MKIVFKPQALKNNIWFKVFNQFQKFFIRILYFFIKTSLNFNNFSLILNILLSRHINLHFMQIKIFNSYHKSRTFSAFPIIKYFFLFQIYNSIIFFLSFFLLFAPTTKENIFFYSCLISWLWFAYHHLTLLETRPWGAFSPRWEQKFRDLMGSKKNVLEYATAKISFFPARKTKNNILKNLTHWWRNRGSE